MKAKRTDRPAKKILLGILVMMMLFSFASCAKKIKFLTSSTVPAAQGYVTVKRDNNQNYVIKIILSNLAEVKRLQPARSNYVVWMETDKGRTENLGQLNSSSGFLSKNLKASMETTSSYKPAKVFITAEDNTNVQYPGNQVILTTSKF
ncbi:MAG: hypothetical protein KDD02_13680 [Phaeodactylibacter sp.]|nr:hypothetical protein [Phaeodactylibacter sp.]